MMNITWIVFTFVQQQMWLFSDINISKLSNTSVERWDTFNDCFAANFLESVTVKELWKSSQYLMKLSDDV